MAVLVRYCCANVALTTAIAMATTVVHPAAQTLALQTNREALPALYSTALTLTSLESGLAAVDAAPAQSAFISPREVTQTVFPAAAEASPGDALYDFARQLVFWASVAVLPLWWIAFPVTFPLGYIIGSQVLFTDPGYAGLFGNPTTWGILSSIFALPVVLAFELLPSREELAFESQQGLSAATDTRTPASTVHAGASAAPEVPIPHVNSATQGDALLSAIPAAAETAEENPFETPLGQVLLALNFLVLPLWFLAAPITLPLSMLAAASRLPDSDSPLNSLLFLAGTGIAFLTGPLGALSILLQPDPTPAAAVRASSAASSTDTASESEAEITPVAPPATKGRSDNRQTASAPSPVRGRVTGLVANENPKSAAALRVKADQATDAKTDESADLATSDDTKSTESPAARDGRGSAKANNGSRNP